MSCPHLKANTIKMEHTSTMGKDAPLNETIRRMTELLSHHGFTVQESSWLNPVPHVWSVHITDGDCSLLTTNGKGNTREAALASALGEFFERLATNFFFADYWLGVDRCEAGFIHFPQEKWFPLPQEQNPWANPAESTAEGPALHDLFGDSGDNPELLDEFTRAVYNPHGEVTPGMLKDLFSGNNEGGICALPFTRVHDGKTIFFPVNVLDNLYTSNGMAAGNTMDEAVVQALCEIMERGVKHRIIGWGIALPDIPDAMVDKVFGVRQGIDALERQGMKLFVKDASLGGVFPVVNVTLVHQKTGGCYAAFGAHPDMEIALVRTFAELLQGRSLDQLDRFPLPSLDLETTGDPQNIEAHFIDSSGTIPWQMLKDRPDHPFVDWGVKKGNRELKSSLFSLLDGQGHQVYIAEYRHLGMDVCRILVPGFSEIYPVEDLCWSNSSQGLFLQNSLLSLEKLTRQQLQALSEELAGAELSDLQPLAGLLGIPMEEESIWQELYLPEIKAHLFLALGSRDHARFEIENLLFSGYLNPSRTRQYQCLLALMTMETGGVDADSYSRVLTGCFGAGVLADATEMLAGRKRFCGLEAMEKFQTLPSRRALVRAYRKTQTAKKQEPCQEWGLES